MSTPLSNPAINNPSYSDLAARSGVSAGKTWAAVLAFVLGTVIVLAVGFAPGIAHNAAHDTRHTMVFPCH